MKDKIHINEDGKLLYGDRSPLNTPFADLKFMKPDKKIEICERCFGAFDSKQSCPCGANSLARQNRK